MKFIEVIEKDVVHYYNLKDIKYILLHNKCHLYIELFSGRKVFAFRQKLNEDDNFLDLSLFFENDETLFRLKPYEHTNSEQENTASRST